MFRSFLILWAVTTSILAGAVPAFADPTSTANIGFACNQYPAAAGTATSNATDSMRYWLTLNSTSGIVNRQQIWKAVLACGWQLYGQPAAALTQSAATGGTFITFDEAGSSGGPVPTAINDVGAVTGYYFDAAGLSHSFLHGHGGAVISFDPPGASFGSAFNSINLAGEVTGYYQDANGYTHGFVRAPNGTFTTSPRE